jgi:hypothetical protein
VIAKSRERVEELQLKFADPDSNTVIEPLSDPILKYGDPTRDNDHGSLWLWGSEGRPHAVLDLFRGTDSAWVYVFTLLSGESITARRGDQELWQPRDGDFTLKSLDVTPPADNAAQRLRQLRSLARRFTAHEFWGSRYELRLLSSPLHRYADPDAGIIDGALFAFANGTNPEVILLLEAQSEGSTQRWAYALARMADAELHVHWDGVEVWTVPRAFPGDPAAPYWAHSEPEESE